MLDAMGDEGTDTMNKICRLIWSTGTWPEDWTKLKLTLIHTKEQKDFYECYGTIALISSTNKLTCTN